MATDGSGARADATEKLSGRAAYLADLPVPADTLHVAAVRSTVAHGILEGVEYPPAGGAPPVAVLDRDQLWGLDPSGALQLYGPPKAEHDARRREPSPVAVDRVRYVGDLVALVGADRERQAVRLAAAARVGVSELPAVGWSAQPPATRGPPVHDGVEDNVAVEERLATGDLTEGFSRADEVVEATLSGGQALHLPLESPTPVLVVPDDSGRLEVVIPTEKPYEVVDNLARLLGMPPEHIRVRCPWAGAGFGAKHTTQVVLGCAALARGLGRPVRYVATTLDGAAETARHGVAVQARLGVRRDGSITALEADLRLDTGAYFTGAALVTNNAITSAWGPYRIPAMSLRARALYSNHVPAGKFRATGKNQTTFAVERLMDLAASAVGLDGVEFRRRNVLRRGERMPRTWIRNGTPVASVAPPVDTDYASSMERALSVLRRRAGLGGSRLHGAAGSRRWGMGVGLSMRPGTGGQATTEAEVTLVPGGGVTVAHNATDLGSGVHHVLRMIAVRSLGLDPSAVTVEQPDTATGLRFAGTVAQRTTVQMGRALVRACDGLRDAIVARAVQRLGGPAEGWSWEPDGTLVHDAHGRLTLAELAGGHPLRATGTDGVSVEDDLVFGRVDHWGTACVAALVEVDEAEASWGVRGLVAVSDAGCVLSPGQARSQILGGMVQGLSLCTVEELRYDEAQVPGAHPWRYGIATMSQVPEILDVAFVENGDGPGPFGAKGIAQTSLPCVAGAVAGALQAACGFRPDRMPFGIDLQARLVETAGRAGACA